MIWQQQTWTCQCDVVLRALCVVSISCGRMANVVLLHGPTVIYWDACLNAHYTYSTICSVMRRWTSCAVLSALLCPLLPWRRAPKSAESVYYFPNVCQSVRMAQLHSKWTHCHKIWYLSIYRKSAEKIEVSVTKQCDKNNGTAHAADRHMCV
jgi:hypothetical protein